MAGFVDTIHVGDTDYVINAKYFQGTSTPYAGTLPIKSSSYINGYLSVSSVAVGGVMAIQNLSGRALISPYSADTLDIGGTDLGTTVRIVRPFSSNIALFEVHADNTLFYGSTTFEKDIDAYGLQVPRL